MVRRSSAAAPVASPVVVSRSGETRVFATPEEAREFLSQPLSEAEAAQGLRAIRIIEELHQMVLDRTRGQGVSEEDMEDALRATRDH